MTQTSLYSKIFVCLVSLCYFSIVMTYPDGRLSVSGDCKPMLEISCSSSCSFASGCWGISYVNNNYIHCTWNNTIANNFHYTSSIQANRKYCPQKVTCEKQIYDLDSVSTCHVYIFDNASECNFITHAKTLLYVVKVYDNDNNQLCSSSATFNPCYIVKVDPPVIDEIKSDESLQVEVSPPQCTTNTWSTLIYKLKYVTFDGTTLTSEKYLSYPPFRLPFYEANQYNISLYAAIDQVPEVLRVWSNARTEVYLTDPTTATDDDVITFHCSPTQDNGTVVVSWQKTGMVDRFKCSFTDTRNPDDMRSLYVRKKQNDQSVFNTAFSQLNLHLDYNVTVVAINRKGTSGPTSSIFSMARCNTAGSKPTNCRRISGDSDWMVVAWVEPPAALYNNVKVEISTAADGVITSPDVSLDRRNYNITNLQTCELYTINILSYYGGVQVGACTFTSYTKEIQPMDAPEWMITEKNASSISINILISSSTRRCGEITSYEIVFADQYNNIQTFQSETSSVVIHGLKPYSGYQVQAVIINHSGKGPLSPPRSAMTGQAAPSDPPRLSVISVDDDLYLVEWMKPREANGIISDYWMFITSEETFSVTDQNLGISCVFVNSTTKCRFPGQQSNATMRLPGDGKVEMMACTDKGEKCSVKSFPVPVTQSNIMDVIIISVFCVVIIFAIIFMSYAFISSLKSSNVKGPVIPPEILHDFSEMPDCDRKSSKSLKELNEEERNIIDCERYDSVEEWRGTSGRYNSPTSVPVEKVFFYSPSPPSKLTRVRNKSSNSTDSENSAIASSGSFQSENKSRDSRDDDAYCTSEQAASLFMKNSSLPPDSYCWRSNGVSRQSSSECASDVGGMRTDDALLHDHEVRLAVAMAAATKPARFFSGNSNDSGISSAPSVSPL